MLFLATLRQQLDGLRLIGVSTALHTVLSSRQRSRLDKRFPLPPVDETPRNAGRPLAAESIPGGVRIQFEAANFVARFLTPDMLFTAWEGADMSPSYAVNRWEWPGADVRVDRLEGGWRVKSAELELRISAEGTLRYVGCNGQLLREETPPVQKGRGWTQTAALEPDEYVYGLGGRTAPLNRRRATWNPARASPTRGAGVDKKPVVYRFWNHAPGGPYGPGADPLYISMPVYLCARGGDMLLVFHDNTFDGSLSLGPDIRTEFVDGPCRTYFIAGSPHSILSRFTELTGRASLPPRWALGYHHSRWGFGSLNEVRRVFEGFTERGLPLHVLHLDIDHMRGYRTLTTDEAAFPDLGAFSEKLHACGVRLVAIVDPGIKKDRGFSLYADALAQGNLCKLPDGKVIQGVVWPGPAVFADYTKPAVRAWWGRQYRGEISRGIDGFWHDMNEPACFAASGVSTLPLCVRHDMEGRGGDHREAHNVYGMLMNQAGCEGLRALRPDSRSFIVSRSGWVGMQRWSWSWTGDVETSWEALRATPAMVIGLGLCGMPYSGPDIGGFSGAPSSELYVRWFQLGSFMPFFRTHCAIRLPRREPWCFGPQAQAIVKGCLQMRERLIPYWYTLAWKASGTGLPLVRPLFWAEPQSRELQEIDDQFLLGDDLLVAPVLEEGARTRAVILPQGTWYELHGDARYTGPDTLQLNAPLETVPVLVRGGSIIPLLEANGLSLHAFRPADGGACEGHLYDDAGDGFGPHRVDSLRIAPCLEPRLYELTWASEGGFAWRYSSVTIILHGFDNARVVVTGQPPAQVSIC
ncbi:MAG: TIM-barrel domain-containing protein [Spirochaetia bacterium]|jgi:alpha-glucosidase